MVWESTCISGDTVTRLLFVLKREVSSCCINIPVLSLIGRVRCIIDRTTLLFYVLVFGPEEVHMPTYMHAEVLGSVCMVT